MKLGPPYLIRAAAERSGMQPDTVERAVHAFLEEAKDATWRQGYLVLPEFLTLRVRPAKPASGAVAKTGGLVVKAKVSKTWRTGP